MLKDCSTDQSLLYQFVHSDQLPRDIALRKVHIRWLTFTETNVLMWISKYYLTGEMIDRLDTTWFPPILVHVVQSLLVVWATTRGHPSPTPQAAETQGKGHLQSLLEHLLLVCTHWWNPSNNVV